MLNFKITSSVTADNSGLQIFKDTPLALQDALRLAQQFYGASRINSEYKSVLTSLAKRLNSKVEAALAKALGGVPIKEGTGGFYPDFYLLDKDTGDISFQEQKLVATTEKDGRFSRAKPIGLAGGEGIVISRGTRRVLTGFDIENNKPKAKFEQLFTSRFVNDLLAAKDNPAELIRVMNGRGKAASAFRNTLALKANSINIPTISMGVLQNRTMKFSWKEIQEAVLRKKMSITVIETANGVKLNLYFSSAVINKALNDANKVIVREIQGELGREVLRALSSIATLPSGTTPRDLKLFLEGVNFQHAAEYVAGSAIIARGVIASPKQTKQQDKEDKQRFISGIQWTVLTQKRLGETMLRLGDPEPPNLKERTGRFRGSVQVIPNYRTMTLQYLYNPLYRSLEKYGYNPNMQVETAIREVAQSLFAQKFNIVRGNRV